MRPSTTFYTEREAIRFIERNQMLVGVSPYVDIAKQKTDSITGLTYTKEQTGTNIYVWYILCHFDKNKTMPLRDLVNLNDRAFWSQIKG